MCVDSSNCQKEIGIIYGILVYKHFIFGMIRKAHVIQLIKNNNYTNNEMLFRTAKETLRFQQVNISAYYK